MCDSRHTLALSFAVIRSTSAGTRKGSCYEHADDQGQNGRLAFGGPHIGLYLDIAGRSVLTRLGIHPSVVTVVDLDRFWTGRDARAAAIVSECAGTASNWTSPHGFEQFGRTAPARVAVRTLRMDLHLAKFGRNDYATMPRPIFGCFVSTT
jgi:hypothetical protein